MAPEIFKNEPYKLEADIWSLGIILFYLAAGKLPFKESDSQSTMNRILFSNPTYPTNITTTLKDLIGRMLTKMPDQRISILDIANHPWFSPREYAYISIIVAQWKDFEINLSVIPKMESIGISIDNIRQNITLRVFNESTTIYRILCRQDFNDKLQRIPRSQTFKPMQGRARSETMNKIKLIQPSASSARIKKMSDEIQHTEEKPIRLEHFIQIEEPNKDEKKKSPFRPRSRSRSTKTALMLTENFT